MRFSVFATYLFWALPVALQPLIAVAMFRRGLIREFPVFFTYNVSIPARDTALYILQYVLRSSKDLYAAVYWWGDAASIVLTLGIIIETSWHFIRPYPFLRFFLRVLWISAVIAGGGAVAMLIWTEGPAGADVALEWILLSERSAKFLQVCLLIVAIAFMSRLGLSWRDYGLGIAAGFGVYAALDLIVLELGGHLHVLDGAAFVLLRSAAYNLGVVIWAIYFLWPGGGNPVDRLPGTDLTSWNDELSKQVDKWYRR
jgi:hypothetical protein